MAGKLFVDYVQTESGTLYVQNYSGNTIFSANATGLYSPSGKTYITANGNITGNVIGNLTGTVTGNVVATTISTGSLTSNTSLITSGTAQNTTSGTAIDFTGIPAGVKRITVMLSGVRTNGSTDHLFQLGAGNISAAGYLGASSRISGATPATANYTAGFGLNLGGGAGANILHGSIVITLIGSNIWSAMGVFSISNNNATVYTSGSIALGGVLDRLRMTTGNGTDTFNAGSVNILYE